MIRVRKGNRSRTPRPRSRARHPDREIQRSEPMYGVLSIARRRRRFLCFLPKTFRRRVYLFVHFEANATNTPRFDPTTTTVTARRAGSPPPRGARAKASCTARDVFARDRAFPRGGFSPPRSETRSATRGDAFPRLPSRAPTDARRACPPPRASRRAVPVGPEGRDPGRGLDELAARVVAAAFFGEGDGDARVFVGIAGAPGWGKSTLARLVRDRVNAAAGTTSRWCSPWTAFITT